MKAESIQEHLYKPPTYQPFVSVIYCYILIIQIESESMSCKILSACLQSKLLVTFLHRLCRRIETVPRLTVIRFVLVDELQERLESRFLQHAHQICRINTNYANGLYGSAALMFVI